MDIWKHGTYLDMWSIVHFLSGFLLAGLCYELGYTFINALFFSTLALLAWELFEWTINIIEPSLNVATDIVIGLVGFLFAAYFYYFIESSVEMYFYPVLVSTSLLAFWGFFDFLKRGYR